MGSGRCDFSADDVVIKSPNDRRLYRLLRLDNGLTALLVHDPEVFAGGPPDADAGYESDGMDCDSDDEHYDNDEQCSNEDDDDDDDDEEDEDDDGEEDEERVKGIASQTKKVYSLCLWKLNRSREKCGFWCLVRALSEF